MAKLWQMRVNPISSYLAILRSRGLCGVTEYFREAHLYDIRHRTRTAFWIPANDLKTNNPFRDAVDYMPCWTSTVERARHHFELLFPGLSSRIPFIDVGCGAGKVITMWALLGEKSGNGPEIVGIEADHSLAKICRENIYRLGIESRVEIVERDILRFNDYPQTEYLLFLYNPFSDKTLEQLLARVSRLPTFVIYVNPVHMKSFQQHGFKARFIFQGASPPENFAILTIGST